MTHPTTSGLLSAARAYAASGFPVFPLHSITLTGDCTCGRDGCGSPGKHPRTRNGVKDASLDADEIGGWWEQWPDANIGVACGSPGLYVVDIDGERGAESWRALCAEHGGEVATRSVTTGNGRHLWYRTDEDGLGNSASRLGEGIDTRGDGGYVVAPPSVHASGGGTLYSWDNHGTAPTRLPEWVAALLRKPAPEPVMPFTSTGQPSEDHVQRRLDGLAAKVAMAPEGQRNHVLNWAAHQAGRMVGGGWCDQSTAEEVLLFAAHRAGLDERETRLTIASGIESGLLKPDPYQSFDEPPPPATVLGTAPPSTVTTPAGVELAVHDLPGTAAQTALQRALERVEDGASFILDSSTSVEPVWGDDDGGVLWARSEPTYLTGPTGVGKTTVTHQIIERLLGLVDDDLLGYPVPMRAKKVLYLACDRPAQIRRAFSRRFGEAARDVLAERLAVHNGYLPVMVDQDPHLLVQLVREVGADVLVVDSLKDVATELEKGPSAQAINGALQLVVQAGCEVIVLHHQRKSQSDNKRPKSIDDLYGNTLLPAGAGSVLLLWGKPGDLAVELHHLKTPSSEVGPLKLLHRHDVGRTVVDEAERVDLVLLAGRVDLTVALAANHLYGTPLDGKTGRVRNDREKARYQLRKAVERGVLREVERPGLASVWVPCEGFPEATEVPL